MNRVVDKHLKLNIQNKLKSTFSKTIDNPVVKAHQTWEILSEQLKAILDNEVYAQWFNKVQPIILKNNILIVQAETTFAARWINTHYQELVDSLLLIQDKKHSCFFIAPKKLVNKSTRSKINSYAKK